MKKLLLLFTLSICWNVPSVTAQEAEAPPADSTAHSFLAGRIADADEIAAAPKFWFVEDMWNWMLEEGISEKNANTLSFIVVCITLGIIVWLANLLIFRIILSLVKKVIDRTRFRTDNILYQHNFFHRILYLIPFIIINFGLTTLFRGFDPEFIRAAQLISWSAIIIITMLICFSLLDTLGTIYQNRPRGRQRSIKGYLQVSKITTAFITAILVISVLRDRSPTTLLVGLGAAAAILSLVFKDTLLGFVASIQLSAQDMVRLGDWIVVPDSGADGIVLDINVTSVKVQNWDNTLSMVPIYSLVSQPFVNWRGMYESTGRRVLSHYYIDISTVNAVGEEFFTRIRKHPLTSPYAETIIKLARNENPEMVSNANLFRAHVQLYLFRNPRLNPRLLTYAHYSYDLTEKGLLLEVSAFSKVRSFYTTQIVGRSVMEYVLLSAGVFGLRFYQSPSGNQVNTALQEIEEDIGKVS